MGSSASIGTDTKGKAPRDLYALTDAGWEFLLAQVNPKQVLEDFVRVLEERQGEVGELLDTARRMADSLQGLKDAVARVLPTVSIDAGASTQPPARSLKRERGLRSPSPGSEEGLGDLRRGSLDALAVEDRPRAGDPRAARRLVGRGRRGLPAAGALPLAFAPGRAALDRRVPRLPAATPRGRDALPAPVDRPALRPARAGVRAARRPQRRLLRFRSRLITAVEQGGSPMSAAVAESTTHRPLPRRF